MFLEIEIISKFKGDNGSTKCVINTDQITHITTVKGVTTIFFSSGKEEGQVGEFV